MIKNIYEFKSDSLNFKLRIDRFDCIDYHTCLDICRELGPGEVAKKEWVNEFVSLPNLRVSFENKNNQESFVPLTKGVLNSYFEKNIHSTAFIFNSIVEYVVETYNHYNQPEIEDESEKKSLTD